MISIKKFKIEGSHCPGLHFPLLSPRVFFLFLEVFVHQDPAEQIPFEQFVISPPPF